VYTRQHNAAEQGKLREERVILSVLDRSNQAVLIWPQTRILVPAAAVLGVLVAGLVVLGMVFLDDSIRSPADVREHLGLPLLGMIPRQRILPQAASPAVGQATQSELHPMAPPTTSARR
jgi:capsular polysaccharide biosynthesis protein